MSAIPEPNRVRDRIVRLVPSLVLALFAYGVAHAQFYCSDYWWIMTSTMGYPPRPLEWARTGSQLLLLSPIAVFLLGCLSLRWRWLGGRTALVFQAGFILIGNLAVAYMMLVPASQLGYFPDSRLPHSARRVFEQATTINVLALEPDIDLISPTKQFNETNFHGYTINRTVALNEPVQVSNVVQSVFRSIDEAWLPPAICFIPHHGMIVKSPRGEMHLIICYECDRVFIYFGEKQAWDGIITSSAMPLLNEILRASASPR